MNDKNLRETPIGVCEVVNTESVTKKETTQRHYSWWTTCEQIESQSPGKIYAWAYLRLNAGAWPPWTWVATSMFATISIIHYRNLSRIMCVVRRWLVAAACLDTTPRDRLGSVTVPRLCCAEPVRCHSCIRQSTQRPAAQLPAPYFYPRRWEMLHGNQRVVRPISDGWALFLFFTRAPTPSTSPPPAH